MLENVILKNVVFWIECNCLFRKCCLFVASVMFVDTLSNKIVVQFNLLLICRQIKFLEELFIYVISLLEK